MKATLTFNLPDESQEFRTAIDGWKWKSALNELSEELRSKAKWDNNMSEEQREAYQQVREKIVAILNENNLRFDE